MTVSAMYIYWEGRSYAPECFYHDICTCIKALGSDGPFFAIHTEVGVILSTTPEPRYIHDAHSKAGSTDEPCHLTEFVLVQDEFTMYETWHELVMGLNSGDESEEDYNVYANEALVQRNEQLIQIMSLDEGPFDMNSVGIEEARTIIENGSYVEIYLGEGYDGTPLVGLIFKNGHFEGTGIDDLESLLPLLGNLAQRLILAATH